MGAAAVETSPRIPAKKSDFTAEWLTEVFASKYPGTTVTSLQVDEVDQGTSTRLRLTAEYADPSPDLPTQLFVKTNFDNVFGELFTAAGIYHAEVKFFNDVLPAVDIPTPRCLHAELSDEDGSFVLVLEDVVAADWGKAEEPIDWVRAEAVLKAMARYHAHFWNSPKLDDLEWVWTPNEGPQADAIKMFSDYASEKLAAGTVFDHPVPEALRDSERVKRAVEALLRYDAEVPRTLLHSDPHLKNLGFHLSGEPIFVDWQVLRKGCWALDVSYFLSTSLSTDDRRAHERDLVTGYLKELAGYGIDVPADEAWLQYRAQPLYGLLVWLATPVEMQPEAAVRAFTLRFLAAAEDLDTMGAIDEVSGKMTTH
ncbi:hypothetical protein ABLE94_12015 [Gordonia sp. VNK1]|uniref:hypothetical protein n=1 Tax=Gordonia TaxID=2053 RepID=UPI0032B46AF8